MYKAKKEELDSLVGPFRQRYFEAEQEKAEKKRAEEEAAAAANGGAGGEAAPDTAMADAGDAGNEVTVEEVD